MRQLPQEKGLTGEVALGSSASCTAPKALDTILNEPWPSIGSIFQRDLLNGVPIALVGAAGALFPLLHIQVLEHMRSPNHRTSRTCNSVMPKKLGKYISLLSYHNLSPNSVRFFIPLSRCLFGLHAGVEQ